jgi:signal recognition particle GTPase
MAKMDGNARGCTIVRIAYELHIPIIGAGTGETERDLAKNSWTILDDKQLCLPRYTLLE